jgi:chromate transport protein ChrA
MSDDLARLFVEDKNPVADESFVSRVSGRIAWHKRMLFAIPLVAGALLVLAVWATWPAAYRWSGDAVADAAVMAVSLRAFATSQIGMLAIAVLLLTVALWLWLYERVRRR